MYTYIYICTYIYIYMNKDNYAIMLYGVLTLNYQCLRTFFGFDLTPDACDGSCFHLVQKGNLRIEMHFAAALQQTINVVVYAEFESVLEIAAHFSCS